MYSITNVLVASFLSTCFAVLVFADTPVFGQKSIEHLIQFSDSAKEIADLSTAIVTLALVQLKDHSTDAKYWQDGSVFDFESDLENAQNKRAPHGS